MGCHPAWFGGLDGFCRCRAQVCSESLLDGGHAHIPVGFRPVHLREHGLCRWVDSTRPLSRADSGRREKLAPTFSCLVDSGWTWSTRNLVCSWQAPLEDSKQAPAPGPPCSWQLWDPLGGLRGLRCRSGPALIQPIPPPLRLKWTWSPPRPPGRRKQNLRRGTETTIGEGNWVL